jgi:hypothetical protein
MFMGRKVEILFMVDFGTIRRNHSVPLLGSIIPRSHHFHHLLLLYWRQRTLHFFLFLLLCLPLLCWNDTVYDVAAAGRNVSAAKAEEAAMSSLTNLQRTHLPHPTMKPLNLSGNLLLHDRFLLGNHGNSFRLDQNF